MNPLPLILILAASSAQAVPLGYPGCPLGPDGKPDMTQPDPRPKFQPSGNVVWKVEVANNPEIKNPKIYWARNCPVAPLFEFETIQGEIIKPAHGLWVCADWWDASSAQRSNYGANPDELTVTLTDADRAAIRSNWPGYDKKSSDGQSAYGAGASGQYREAQPPPPGQPLPHGGKSEISFWLICGIVGLMVLVAILKEKVGGEK